MIKKYNIYLLVFLLFSCEDILFEEDFTSTNPQQNFDYLWQECHEKYAYFEVKGIDWNAIYGQYSAKIYEGMTEDSLFRVMGDMMNELRDDHANLRSDFNVSFFDTRYQESDNFDWQIVREYYLPRNYYVSGSFRHDFLNYTNQEIGYIRFSSFTGAIDDDNLDFVLNRYQNTKGLIFDLRENGGGAMSDVFKLLERFIDRRTLVYYSRIKNGAGQNDSSEAEPTYISPSNQTLYTKPIFLLVDRGTYSAGSFLALAAKAIPNMTLMGHKTGGGLGLPNGGQLPNGWYYRFSVTQALNLNMDASYENGVPVDIPVELDRTVLDVDEIIERAVEELQE